MVGIQSSEKEKVYTSDDLFKGAYFIYIFLEFEHEIVQMIRMRIESRLT
jgi:hypothetical protein